MAERRMFTKKITESDAFLDMPSSTQMLYFHLSMNADDDGFVNNPRRIQRMCGAFDDDFKLLIAKSFVIAFENGVIVIRHWKLHNYIQADRYKPTDYIDEKSKLGLEHNKSYTLDENKMVVKCILDISANKAEGDSFVPPSIDEVREYCCTRGNNIDAQFFIEYYTARNWETNKRKIKDWKSKIRSWEKRNGNAKSESTRGNIKKNEESYDKTFFGEFE